MRTNHATRLTAVVLGAFALLVTACGGDDEPAAERSSAAEEVTLRLGYFPNVTHATALAGVRNGIFEEALGDDVTLETATYNAGPEAIEAIFADAIDATYIGPNPAINAFAQSEGRAVRIVSGATSGGAFLVVREGIGPEDLRGTTLATPQLGNTQDVALRTWLAEQGLETDTAGGGAVEIAPQANSDTLAAFRSGDVDGAWVPEPWATRLVREAGGRVLVDEADLWPDGRYVTTHLIVRTEFLEEHPDVVRRLLEGHVEATEFVNESTADAQRLVNEGIEAAAGSAIDEQVLADAWGNLEFTNDPIASSLEQSARDAEALGLLEPVDLDGIYDLTLLNEVLDERGLAAVDGL